MGKKWTEDELNQLVNLRGAGQTHQQIADTVGKTRRSVRDRIERFIAQGRLTSNSGFGGPRFQEILSLPDMPVYTKIPTIVGNCIVVGDIHIPTTFWELAEMVSVVADKHLDGDKTLIIAGDFINADALSHYPFTVAPPTLSQELLIARELLQIWSETFDRIIMFMGNHEMRVFKNMYGSIGGADIRALFVGEVGEKFELYNIGQVIVNSGNERWRITHQNSYSKIKGRTANVLAQKHQSNIISHHEHHVAIMRDDFDYQTIVNNGGLHDHEKMAYVSQFDSNRPIMNNGFVMLRNGVPQLFTPYRSMTDWGQWDIDATALFEMMDARIENRRLG